MMLASSLSAWAFSMAVLQKTPITTCQRVGDDFKPARCIARKRNMGNHSCHQCNHTGGNRPQQGHLKNFKPHKPRAKGWTTNTSTKPPQRGTTTSTMRYRHPCQGRNWETKQHTHGNETTRPKSEQQYQQQATRDDKDLQLERDTNMVSSLC